jgi:RES domain-containing protein
MRTVWRLTPPAFASVLDGEGNRKTGARWNSPGRGVIYTCANLSLCVLETYVHIPAVLRLALPDFEAVQLRVPDDGGTTQITTAQFEKVMSLPDPASACRTVGDLWLTEEADLVLAAPSVVVPEELNVMINPVHPRMRDVRIIATRRFRFDTRLAGA